MRRVFFARLLLLPLLLVVAPESRAAEGCRVIRTTDRIPVEFDRVATSDIRCCSADFEPVWWCTAGRRQVIGKCDYAGGVGEFWACMPAPASAPVSSRNPRTIAQPPQNISTPVPVRECTDVDLRAEMPPRRNQAGTAWCYAYVASDLLGERYGRDFSAAALAFEFNEDKFADMKPDQRKPETADDSEILKGFGNVRPAIEASLKRGGFCLERDFSSKPDSTREFLPWVTDPLYAIRRLSYQYAEKPDRALIAEVVKESKKSFPGVDQGFVEGRVLSGIKGDGLLIALKNEACRERFLPEEKVRLGRYSVMNAIQQKAPKDTEEKFVIAKLDDALAAGRPAALAVPGGEIFEGMEGGSHAMSAVARRKAGAECQYLLRNSFGSDYKSYLSEFENEGGDVWVPSSTLESFIWDVEWVE